MSLISVIISHRNSLAALQASIRSVLQQRAEFELLVLDYHAAADAERYEEQTAVRIPVRGSVAKGFNLAIERARGEALKFMIAGDELAAGTLNEQSRALNHEHAEVCYSDHQYFMQDAEGTRVYGARHANHLANPKLDLLTTSLPLSSLLFSRAAVQRVGSFNDSVEPLCAHRFTFDCADAGARFARAQALGAFIPKSGEHCTLVDLRRCQSTNLGQIMDRWLTRGQLDDEKRHALRLAMVELARFSARQEPEIFQNISQRYQSLGGNFVPKTPLRLRLAASVLGYPNAERWLRIPPQQ